MISFLTFMLYGLFFVLATMAIIMPWIIGNTEKKLKKMGEKRELALIEDKRFMYWLRTPFSSKWSSFEGASSSQIICKLRKFYLVQVWSLYSMFLLIPPLNRFIIVLPVLFKGYDFVKEAEGSKELLIDIYGVFYFATGYLIWGLTSLFLLRINHKKYELIDQVLSFNEFFKKLWFLKSSWIEQIDKSHQKSIKAFQNAFRLLFIWAILSISIGFYRVVIRFI